MSSKIGIVNVSCRFQFDMVQRITVSIQRNHLKGLQGSSLLYDFYLAINSARKVWFFQISVKLMFNVNVGYLNKTKKDAVPLLKGTNLIKNQKMIEFVSNTHENAIVK